LFGTKGRLLERYNNTLAGDQDYTEHNGFSELTEVDNTKRLERYRS
jgi:hypothetical protein